MRVLVTGGAGFIGSYIVDALVGLGYDVVILDNLDSQVHPSRSWPRYANPRAKYHLGDVSDPHPVRAALEGVSIVIHNASAVGIAQSQYEIRKFSTANVLGTSTLFEAIVRDRLPITKVVVPASMSSYGEGQYHCMTHGSVRPGLRRKEDLMRQLWEPLCPVCRECLTPLPTAETAALDNFSVYSLTKSTQEHLALLLGRLYGIPTVVFRYFNVYGPRQSVSNPYTGVSAIFTSRLKNGRPPIVYEDGLQSRDFISVHDVVRANMLALSTDQFDGRAVNIGSGTPTAIIELARLLGELLGVDATPALNGDYRLNDIRHCYADVSRAVRRGFMPKISLRDGLRELVDWAREEDAVDRFDAAADELRQVGLLGAQ